MNPVITLFKEILRRLIVKSGTPKLFRKILNGHKVAILRYHAVVDPIEVDYAVPSICIKPSDFEKQIKYLSKRYNVISLDTLYNCLNEKKRFPDNAVIITFDDGYRDNFLAYKILKSYGIKGTFFICTDPITTGQPLWLMEVVFRLKKTKQQSLELQIGNKKVLLLLFSLKDRMNSIRELVHYIKTHSKPVREMLMNELRSATTDVSDCDTMLRNMMLSWDHVREMAEAGMEIGGHTTTHLNLPHADPEDANFEIVECKSTIESIIGSKVHHFSYPNGGGYSYFNDSIVNMVQRAGYKTACTSSNGVVKRGSNPFILKRVRVTNDIAQLVYDMDCEPFVNLMVKKLF